VTRRILGLAAIQFAVGLVITELLPAGAPSEGRPVALVGFIAAFALAGFLPVHLEFGRGSYAVVLDEAVLVVGLFTLSPAALVLAAVAGDLLSRLVARQAPVKAVYNLGSWFLAAATSTAIFSTVGHHDDANPVAWLGAMLAMAALSGVSLLSISVVLAMVEGRPLREVVVDSAGAQAAVTAANASIGLAVVVLLHVSAAGPFILAPVVGMVAIASRRYATQAAERLRFERLYAAAGRTGELAGFDDALAVLATEARALVTGSVAICCATRGNGDWVGVRVDDMATRTAEPQAVRVLAGLAAAGETRTVSLAELPRDVRRALPDGVDLVVAAPAPPARADVVLAVFREIAPDSQGDLRHEWLGAFAGHAALVVANALLYEEVDAALRRELDMNRQKSEFVAAVSHELRTPLTTVMGTVSTMQRLGARLEGPTQQKLLDRALEQGERLRRLIDELLLVAATEHSGLRADLAPADVGRIVEDAAAGLPGGGGRVQLDLAPCAALVTDGEKVRRIVTNLMENALKYAPTGPITVDLRCDSRYLALAVGDHGPGIPSADRERVFEPFVQLDQSSTRRQGGTGLGLHLCRQLAQLLDGRLDLDETPGGGCRFTLTLPVTSRPAVPLPVLEGAA